MNNDNHRSSDRRVDRKTSKSVVAHVVGTSYLADIDKVSEQAVRIIRLVALSFAESIIIRISRAKFYFQQKLIQPLQILRTAIDSATHGLGIP